MAYNFDYTIQREAWSLLKEEVEYLLRNEDDRKAFKIEQNYISQFNFSLRLNYLIPDKKKSGLEQFAISLPDGLLEQLHQKSEINIKSLTSNSIKVDLIQDWRLVVGLGTASVRDTSMTLHHVYGIPYLPASAIKGVIRSYIIESIFNNSEAKAIQCKGFSYLFGAPEQLKPSEKPFDGKAHQGKLIILDAFPVTIPYLQKDIMTNHYQEYYEKGVQPTDSLTPNPIPFLTVQNCTFRFLLGLRDTTIIEEKQYRGKTIKEWLIESLEELGIGAKTAVGYGYFKQD